MKIFVAHGTRGRATKTHVYKETIDFTGAPPFSLSVCTKATCTPEDVVEGTEADVTCWTCRRSIGCQDARDKWKDDCFGKCNA